MSQPSSGRRLTASVKLFHFAPPALPTCGVVQWNKSRKEKIKNNKHEIKSEILKIEGTEIIALKCEVRGLTAATDLFSGFFS